MSHKIGFSVLAAAALLVAADAPKPYTAWSDYGGAPDSMQYSALKQIDKSNVAKLELAWIYKDNGKFLWEYDIEANPEGLVSTYEINGRQYVAFCASGTVGDGETPQGQNAAWLPGKLPAQGYYVFALPAKGTK